MQPISDDPSLLSLILADQERQAPLYKPGPYWRPYQLRVLRAIAVHGVGDFRSRPSIGKGWADVVEHDPRDQWEGQGSARRWLKNQVARLPLVRGMLADSQRLVELHRRRADRMQSAYYDLHFGAWLRQELARHPLPETLRAGAADVIQFDGQSFAKRYLDVLVRIHNFAQHVDFSRVRTALEIGGGFGATTHLLATRFPIRTFGYLDIPPMIYVATQYLRALFGEELKDYRATRAGLHFEAGAERQILCMCPWQIETAQGSLDLVWNAASFSEMPIEIVRNYARHVMRLLAPDGVICLIMNKTLPGNGTTMPDAILAAFEGARFERFAPALEHAASPIYAIGRRAD